MMRLKTKIKVVSVVTALWIFLILSIPSIIQDSFTLIGQEMSSLSSVYDDEHNPDVRKNLIKNGLYFTAQSAGFGVGAGNVEYYMEKYSIYPVGRTKNIHNWWVEILVNYGVFIFIGYVIMYISLFLNLWRVYRRIQTGTEKMICEALLMGLVSFFMASISSSSIIAFAPQWIFFGFALAFLNYTRIKALERLNPCAL